MVTTVFGRRSGPRPLKQLLVMGCLVLAAEARAPLSEKVESSSSVSEPPRAESEAPVHNGIILLPKVIVRPPESPIFDERELFSQKGLDELLRKRFPGASFKGQPVWLYNYGHLMYADEKRSESLNRAQSFAKALRDVGDVEGSKELREEIYRTFIRRPSWRDEIMDRTLNRNRR